MMIMASSESEQGYGVATSSGTSSRGRLQGSRIVPSRGAGSGASLGPLSTASSTVATLALAGMVLSVRDLAALSYSLRSCSASASFSRSSMTLMNVSS